MKKFEYKKVPAKELMLKEVVYLEFLDRLGAQGWELCLTTSWNGAIAFFYFKREIVD